METGKLDHLVFTPQLGEKRVIFRLFWRQKLHSAIAVFALRPKRPTYQIIRKLRASRRLFFVHLTCSKLTQYAWHIKIIAWRSWQYWCYQDMESQRIRIRSMVEALIAYLRVLCSKLGRPSSCPIIAKNGPIAVNPDVLKPVAKNVRNIFLLPTRRSPENHSFPKNFTHDIPNILSNGWKASEWYPDQLTSVWRRRWKTGKGRWHATFDRRSIQISAPMKNVLRGMLLVEMLMEVGLDP